MTETRETKPQGLFIGILGVSGSGKNTIIQRLLDENESYKQILSYKTRPLREGEQDGVNYHYMPTDAFLKAVDDNLFLEYAKIYDMYYYGTKKSDVVAGIDQGHTLIKEIDIQGLMQIQQRAPEIYTPMLRIFLDLSPAVMEERIRSRAAISDQELANRIKTAERERAHMHTYCQYVLDAQGTRDAVYARVVDAIHDYTHTMSSSH